MPDDDVRVPPPGAEAAVRIAALERELDALTRQRDFYRLDRDSWHDAWRTDQDARHVADAQAAAARALLARARELLVAWDISHDDPGLRRRTELLLADLELEL